MEETTVQSSPVVPAIPKKWIIIIAAIVTIIVVVLAAFFIFEAKNNATEGGTAMLPANTCPDELHRDGGRPTAVYKGKNVEMSEEVYTWVGNNCHTGSNNSKERIVLRNLGINFAAYDKKSGMAGDFVFNKSTIQSNSATNKIIYEFGDTKSLNDGTSKVFPELIYNQVDINTTVKALAEGTVFKVEYQDEQYSKDYSIEIKYSVNDNWMMIHDHITDLKVKEGDVVKAGDILGKVSPNRDGKTGFTEIQIKEGKGNVLSTSYCPFDLLADEVKPTYANYLNTLMNDWEVYYGDPTVFSQQLQKAPACIKTEITE